MSIVPGQGVEDFSERRRSARRSDSSRSSSVVPWSTKVMAVGDGVVSRLFGDGAMHLLRHPPIRRMTLRAGAQFDQVHGLARVALHDVADAMGQGDGVRRLLGKMRLQRAVEVFGAVDGGACSCSLTPASATSSGMS